MAVVTGVIDRLEKILDRLRIIEVKVACGNYDPSNEILSIYDNLVDTLNYMGGNRDIP